MAVSKTPRRYASIAKAAEYLGTSPVTIRRYIADGRLPGYRGPGSGHRAERHMIRVDLNEVDAMMTVIPTVGSHSA